MPQDESRFEGYDGLSLYQQWWLPEGRSRAGVVLVHGFTEHSGRYAELAGRLREHGYCVYALDLRGHGRSEGARVFINSFEQYIADLEVFLRVVGERQTGKPLFLFGHSMGGTIVALLAATRQPDVQGLLLSAPAAQLGKHIFPLLRRLAAALSRILPRLRVLRVSAAWISRDPAATAEFANDPLVFHGRFPVRTGAEILRAVGQMQDCAASIRAPLLVLQGTGDRVVEPSGAQAIYDKATSEDKTLRRYEGLYHALLHEPEREQITAHITEWLDSRTALTSNN